jgi:FlaA1/EpsC-like NDP-sugar epimerase
MMKLIQKIFFRFNFAKNTFPSWIIFNVDLFLCIVSIFLAYSLRFNFNIPHEHTKYIFQVIALLVFVRAFASLFSGTYSMILRYTTIRDLIKLIMTIAAGSVVFFSACYAFRLTFHTSFYIPLSVVVMDFFITTYLLTMMRMMIKYIFVLLSNSDRIKTNVAIYGTKELAVLTKRTLDLDPETNFKVVAFFDDNRNNESKNLEGIKIYKGSLLEDVIRKNNIKTLVIASKTISHNRKNWIVEECLNLGVKVLSAPDIKSWINSSFSAKKLQKINIEDLLERDPIVLDTAKIREQLRDKTILVTGAAGSIGSELVRQIATYRPKKILLLDQAETPMYNIELELMDKMKFTSYEIIIGDITNISRMERLFERHQIDVVYHAAAYKHVPMMEHHPAEAIHNNVFGTKVIADLSVKTGVSKFVMISTDKAVNPTNIMGASKRIAEMYTQSLENIAQTNFITTRFGNVLGSNGSVIPLFKKQIEKGGPITVTHPEVTRFFMTIPEACQLVLEASVMGNGGEIFLFDMGKSVKVADLAKNMIRLSGLEIGKDIQIKYVGLRPGEKLYEELLCDSENNLPTHHPKITIAKVAKNDYKTINSYLTQLIDPVKRQDNYEVVRQMKIIVPEFISKNSVYEALDHITQSQAAKNKVSVN